MHSRTMFLIGDTIINRCVVVYRVVEENTCDLGLRL